MNIPIRRRRLPYVQREVSRHGRIYWYFRMGDNPRIRLPDIYGSDEFLAAYRLALDGQGNEIPKLPRAQPIRKQAIEASLRKSIGRAMARAKAKALPFDLDLEWALGQVEASEFRCPLTGIAFYTDNPTDCTMHPYAPSIDRADPAQGYTMANCRVVIFAINAMLNEWGHTVLERVIRGYMRTKADKR